MGKLFKKVGGLLLGAVGAVIGFIAAGPAGAAIGFSIGMGIGTAAQMMAMRTKLPATSSATGQRLNVSIDPEAHRKIAFGETALGTDQRYWESWGPENSYFDQVIAAASHQIESFGKLYFDNEEVTFSGDNATGAYAGVVFKDDRTIGQPSSALTVGAGTLWTANATMTGVAHYAIKIRWSQEKFPRGIPSRITRVGKGALVYDPRRDSTQPGGSGSHRANVQNTWEYAPTDSNGVPIGRNPALQILWYEIGYRALNPDTGEWILTCGRGRPLDDIDFASFITAANDCEEQEYYSDVLLSTGDAHETNIAVLEGACAGKLMDTGGRISLRIRTDTTGDIVQAFTDGDVLDSDASTWRPRLPLSERWNQGIGSFVDPRALYKLVPFPTVRDTAYETEDGFKRPGPAFRYDAVQDGEQAQKLVRLELNMSRYQGVFTAPFNWRAKKVRIWDCVTLTFPRLGFESKIFRVLEKKTDPMGAIWLLLREDDPSVYTPGTVNPVPAPAAGAGYDPRVVSAPEAGDWTVTPVYLDGGGAKIPILAVTGDPTAPNIVATHAWRRFHPAGEWIYLGRFLTGDEISITLSDLLPGQQYGIRLAYENAYGVKSDFTILGPYTAGDEYVVPVSGAAIDFVPGGPLQEYIDEFEIGNGSIDFAKFAAGIEPVSVVTALPNPSGYTGPRTVFLTTDGQLYRYSGGVWTKAVEAVSVTGQLTNAQIEAIAAAKVTGQLTSGQIESLVASKISGTLADAQIAALAASKITGTLTDAQIAALAASKITGTLTNAQIADLAAAKITGQLSNAQIADLAASKVTGQLGDAQIAAIAAAKLTGQIIGTQITDGAVSTPKLAAGSVVADKIAAGAIVADKIAALAITSDKLAANSVIAGKVAAGAIEAGAIAAGAITTAKLAAGAVTANEIATNAITAVKIQAGAVETAKLAAGAVIADKIATNAVTAVKIAAGAVETAKLAAGSVVADKIAAGAVVADKIATNAVTAVKILAGAITTDKLNANAVTTAKLAAGAVVADTIAANAVTAVKLAAGSVETAKLAANSVTSDKIVANAITAGKIAAAAISSTEIAANAITASRLFVGDRTNMIPDGDLVDPASWSTVGNSWSIINTPVGYTGVTTPRIAHSNENFTGGAANQYRGDLQPVQRWQVAPGTELACRMSSRTLSTATGNVDLYVRWRDAAGAILSQSIAFQRAAPYVGVITDTAIVQAPAGAASVDFRLRRGADLSGSSTGWFAIWDMQIRRANSAELIVDGAITANKIAANAIIAGKIAANAISAGNIQAGAITADKINVATLSAIAANLGTITGGSLSINNKFIVDGSGNVTIRNNTTGQRLVLTNSVLEVFDSSNVRRVRLGIW